MRIGIIDCDLLSRRKHRFPNLACMKISSYEKNNGNDVELVLNYSDINKYDKLYASKVFTDTIIPDVVKNNNVIYGGTGFFFDKAPPLPQKIEHSFPDYSLYNEFVYKKKIDGATNQELRFYTDYSLGFLTRGCFRKFRFCVNKKYDKVIAHSPLNEFLDINRKKICLLDDNFLGFYDWEQMLNELIGTKKKFRFHQGLDERILTDKKCKLLFSSNYDADFTFAFDNYSDKDIIVEKIKMARKYTEKQLRFYVLTAFDKNDKYDHDFWIRDIWELIERIRILSEFNCIPYVMRFNKYKESPYKGTYINIARWVNQVSLFKKMSLKQFVRITPTNSACVKYYYDFLDENPQFEKLFSLRYELGGKVGS